jgi:hypothetical protein
LSRARTKQQQQLLFISSTRERLRNVDLPVRPDGVGQVPAIVHLMAIHEHVHVLTHGALVVEDVPSGLGVSLEDSIQDLPDRFPLDLSSGTADVTLDVWGERHRWHSTTRKA